MTYRDLAYELIDKYASHNMIQVQKDVVANTIEFLIYSEFARKIEKLYDHDEIFEDVDKFSEAVEELNDLSFAVKVLNEIVLLGQSDILDINEYGRDSTRYVFPYGEKKASECLDYIARHIFLMYTKK